MENTHGYLIVKQPSRSYFRARTINLKIDFSKNKIKTNQNKSGRCNKNAMEKNMREFLILLVEVVVV